MTTQGWFLTELDLHELPGGARFTLLTSLVYQSESGTRYVVPPGTETDFASVPRALWNVLPPFGKHSRAAVLHDWLYQVAPHAMSRGMADGLFREAMKALGVGWLTRQTMWSGVRAGGWKPWRRYRAHDREQVA